MYTFELDSAGEDIGIGFELQVVTIVLLGGVSIFGGRGTILGVALAAFIYAGLHSVLLLSSGFNDKDFLDRLGRAADPQRADPEHAVSTCGGRASGSDGVARVGARWRRSGRVLSAGRQTRWTVTPDAASARPPVLAAPVT